MTDENFSECDELDQVWVMSEGKNTVQSKFID